MSAEASPPQAAAARSVGDGGLAAVYARRFTSGYRVFATVLFVVATAQRFKVRAVRVTTTAVALGRAGYPTVAMLAPPRA